MNGWAYGWGGVYGVHGVHGLLGPMDAEQFQAPPHDAHVPLASPHAGWVQKSGGLRAQGCVWGGEGGLGVWAMVQAALGFGAQVLLAYVGES